MLMVILTFHWFAQRGLNNKGGQPQKMSTLSQINMFS